MQQQPISRLEFWGGLLAILGISLTITIGLFAHSDNKWHIQNTRFDAKFDAMLEKSHKLELETKLAFERLDHRLERIEHNQSPH